MDPNDWRDDDEKVALVLAIAALIMIIAIAKVIIFGAP